MHLVNEQEHLYNVQIWDDIKNLILSELNIIEISSQLAYHSNLVIFHIWHNNHRLNAIHIYTTFFSVCISSLNNIKSNSMKERNVLFVINNWKHKDNKIMHRYSNLQSLNIKTLILEFLMALIVIQILYY